MHCHCHFTHGIPPHQGTTAHHFWHINMTRLIPFPFSKPQQDAIKRCLAQGGVLAFPTETAFALGGNALNPNALATVLRLKNRPANKPLLLLVEHAAEALYCCRKVEDSVHALMRAFWPGPLTLVVRAAHWIPQALCNPQGGVALRVSPAPEVMALRALCEGPLIGTSANLSGQAPCYQDHQVIRQFPDTHFGVVQGQRSLLGGVSTVVDASQTPCCIVRQGALGGEEIAKVVTLA